MSSGGQAGGDAHLSQVFLYFPYLSASPGSMTIFCRDLHAHFTARGYRTHICSIHSSGLDGEIVLPPARVTRIGRLNAWLLGRHVCRILRDLDPASFVVIDVSQEFILPARLDRSIVIFHDLIQVETPRSIGLRLIMRAALKRARAAARVVSVSRTTAEGLARLGIPSQVIYNHFDPAQFAPLPAAPEKSFDAVWCGTLLAHKHFDLFEALAAANPDLRFAAVLPEQASSLPNIALFHSLSDAEYRDLLGRSALFVSTSSAEGYGRPAMEAAMLGVPTLLSDIPIYRELYGDVADFFALDAEALIDAFAHVRAAPRTVVDVTTALKARQGDLDDYVAVVESLARTG